MQFEVVNAKGSDLNAVSPTVIKVVGCGGGGSNAVNRMIEADIKNVDFIALNTDLQALNKSVAPNRLAIGQKITQGLGAGGDPVIGEKAAEEDKDAITNILKGANMVFVTAGMGGGTGTGSAPVVARIAKEIGALTVGVVTTPFQWEGPQRMRLAYQGIEKLKEAVDSVIIIPNAKIIDVYSKDMSFVEQLRAADDLLRQGIEGMSTIITLHGTPNIDFADVRAAMKGQGTAIFGIGKSSGDNRAVDAASKAIHNPLLEDTSIDGAKHFLINVCANSSFSLNELDEISKIVCAGASPDYDMKSGVVTDDAFGEEISVTVIATGFGGNESVREQELIEEKKVIEEPPANPNENNGYDDDNTVGEKEYLDIIKGKKFPRKAIDEKANNDIDSENDDERGRDTLFGGKGEERNVKPRETLNLNNSRIKSLDLNDPNTPAVLRRKQNLSRTINFNR